MSPLGRFYRELERRRVIRVVSIYCVAAWIIIEAADVVLPALFMPDWILRLIIILAMIGFPFAVGMAWIFDLTSAGVVRTPDEVPDAKLERPSGRWVDFAAIGILLALVVYLWQRPVDAPQTTVGTAIAVLPFADLSPEGDSAYLGDGIAEELLNSLANLEGLRVAARTSSFAYRNTEKSVQDIGAELKVDTVLEGSVRKAGDQLRITAQLINVSDGFHLWSSTFDRRLDDIFAIQDEIAAAIADAMRVELFADGDETKRATDDITAYELYLKGRHEARQRTAESLERALQYFQQAIAQDNQFAPAHAGLAEAAILIGEYGNFTMLQARALAEPALANALAIDPQLAEAYAARGLLFLETGDYIQAEEALHQAIRLDLDYAQAYLWLGNVYADQDKPVEALKAYQRAHELEPLMIPVLINLSGHLHNFGRYQEARGLLLTLLKIRSQEAGRFRHQLAAVDKDAGNLAAAAEWLETQLETDPWDSKAIVEVGMLYSALGNTDTAKTWVQAAGKMDPDSRTFLENYSVLLLQQGAVKEVRDLAETEIRKFEEEFKQSGAALPPQLSEWGGYAAYFDGDFETAHQRFQVLHQSYTAAGNTIVNVANFEAFCLLVDAAHRIGVEPPADLLPSLQAFIDRRVAAGFAHHKTAYRQALLAAIMDDPELALFHLSTAVDRGWRFLAHYVEDYVFADVRQLPELEALLQRNQGLIARERDRMPQFALPTPPNTPQVTLTMAQMDEYTGSYRAGIGAVKIYREDDKLWARPNQFPIRQLIPVGRDQFLFDRSSRRIVMYRDDQGRITHFENHYEGKTFRAKRVPDTRIPATIELAAEELEAYVGVFAFPSLPNLNATVTRQGQRLFIETTGSPRVEIVPESRRSFYNEVFDSFVRFEQGLEGGFREIILQRPGVEIRGYRVETS